MTAALPPDMPDPTALTPEDLIAAHVDPTSGLATDYLNHFNEVVMLLELLADMPEMRDDVLAWAPASYQEHFLRSGFRGKAVAIAAYAVAPSRIRGPFDATITAIDAQMIAVQAAIAYADDPGVARLGPAAAEALRPLLQRAGGLIHGLVPSDDEALAAPRAFSPKTADIEAVDALFPDAP